MSIKIPEYVAENDPKSKIRVCWKPCKTFLPPLHVQHVQTVQLSFSARVPPNLGSPTLEERFALNRHSKRHLQFFDSFDSYKLPKWIQGKTRFFSSIFFSSRDSDVPLVPFTFQETPGMKASCISKKTNGWRDVNFLHVRMSKLTKVSSSGVTGCLRRRGLLCRVQSRLLWMEFIRNLQGLRHNFKQRKWNVQEQNADCQTTVPSPEEEPNYFVQLLSLQAPSSNYKLKIPLTNNPCANYILRDSKRRNATWLRHPYLSALTKLVQPLSYTHVGKCSLRLHFCFCRLHKIVLHFSVLLRTCFCGNCLRKIFLLRLLFGTNFGFCHLWSDCICCSCSILIWSSLFFYVMLLVPGA